MQSVSDIIEELRCAIDSLLEIAPEQLAEIFLDKKDTRQQRLVYQSEFINLIVKSVFLEVRGIFIDELTDEALEWMREIICCDDAN